MAQLTSGQHRGWRWDEVNNRLDVVVNGTEIGHFDANGFKMTTGRIGEVLTVTDDDSQNMTLAAADIKAGINVHTTVTGGGTVTTDTAANIIADVPLTEDNQAVVSYYINDGTQTATFSAGAGVTVADTGNTVLTDEAAVLVWRRTSATAVTLYIASS